MIEDQPAPIPTSERPVWEMVIEDMRQRDLLGRQRYGTPLQASNGRDSLVDAYQEALDLCVYLRAAIIQREQQRDIIDGLAARVAAQSNQLTKVAEKKRGPAC